MTCERKLAEPSLADEQHVSATDDRQELRTWYLERLRPMLTRAIRERTVDTDHANAFDRDMRELVAPFHAGSAAARSRAGSRTTDFSTKRGSHGRPVRPVRLGTENTPERRGR